MPSFPGDQITSTTISVGENKIFSGTTRNSHVSGEILLAGNHSNFFSGEGEGEKLLLERAERTLYSQFSYSQISGGKGEKPLYQWGKISSILCFFLHPKYTFFWGEILVAENHSRCSREKRGGGKWVYDRG